MLQAIGNQMGLAQAPSQPLGIQNFLQGGIKCVQNERRLAEEKSQRNLLKKYLTQATGDPIQSALISSTIQGKGFGDTFDVGLGPKKTVMQSLASSQVPNTNLLSQIPATNPGLLGNVGNAISMVNTVNQGAGLVNSLGGNTSTLGTLGNIANLGKSTSANTGLLNSLVSLASTPNNNGNIMGSLGGLGTGLQNGINTLNTINKVNNAVSGVQGLLS
jgi:hypothetical protein